MTIFFAFAEMTTFGLGGLNGYVAGVEGDKALALKVGDVLASSPYQHCIGS
jgi:hypothetical protein